MELKKIIKQEKDRLFIVDQECYLIFTGESLNDERPFIRIGNSSALPLETIPLTENIIITDLLIGNPTEEQFNILLNDLRNNKYIGTNAVIKNYLHFQKLFGLNIENTTVADNEHDLPELKNEQNYNYQNSFIGIFYTDGNFEIKHNKEDIINLRQTLLQNFNNNETFEVISQESNKTERYKNKGFMIIDENISFYNHKYFSLQYFPKNYKKLFSEYRIDPRKISEIMLPTPFIFPLINFIKWKNNIEGKIKIYSDNKETIKTIQTLFTKATLAIENYSGNNFVTSTGLKIENIKKTKNLLTTFKSENLKELKILYVHDGTNLHNDLKSNPDLVIITFAEFGKHNLIFKSNDLPVLVISDQRQLNLRDSRFVRIQSNIQYDLHELKEKSDFINYYNKLEEKAFNIDEENLIETIIDSYKSIDNLSQAELFNLKSIVNFVLQKKLDKNIYNQIRKIAESLEQKDTQDLFAANEANFKIDIVYFKQRVYLFYQHFSQENEQTIFSENFVNSKISNLSKDKEKINQSIEKIKIDRQRLKELLTLFTENFDNKQKQAIQELEEQIISRKNYFSEQPKQNPSNCIKILADGSIEVLENVTQNKEKKKIKKLLSNSGKNKKTDSQKTISKTPRNIIITSIAILLVALAIFIVLNLSFSKNDTTKKINFNSNKEQISKVKAENKEKNIFENSTIKQEQKSTKKKITLQTYQEKNSSLSKELKEKIVITNNDIFQVANSIAIENGYDQLNFTKIIKKDPDWIFPGNKFLLPNKQEVTVQKGDNLWQISKNFILAESAEFFKIHAKILAKKKQNKKDEKELKKHSYTKQTKIYLNNLEK